jgi:hypothetical protein
VKVFVDADGRLTDLLARLNTRATRARLTGDSPLAGKKGFRVVAIGDVPTDAAMRAFRGTPSKPAKIGHSKIGHSKNTTKAATSVSAKRARGSKLRDLASPDLLAHTLETFGSERVARRWLSSQCGDLNNQTPLQAIQAGNEAEVERILGCIDYGMLA